MGINEYNKHNGWYKLHKMGWDIISVKNICTF